MNKRYHRQKLVAEINITPFTDVILVLLVIFMITTPLLSQAGLKVKLPEASSTKSVNAKKQIAITVTAEGPVYLDDTLVTTKELKEKLSFVFKANPDISAVLYADKRRTFRDVVSVLDVISGIGITKITIGATDKE